MKRHKSLASLTVCALAFWGLASGLAFLSDACAAEVAFDWSTASGSVTVPAGTTYVATEADMAFVNALSSVTIEGAPASETAVDGEPAGATEAGVLEFRNCTTFPKSGLLRGAGVVKKTGDDSWDFAVTNSEFDGDFRICGGRVVTTTAGAFGKTTKGTTGAVYVESGASLKIASTAVKFAYRPIHIAGTGFTGTGSDSADKALNIDTAASSAVGLLYMDADATVFVRNNSNHYWLGDVGNPFGDNSGGSRLCTEGHALTKTGKMDWYLLRLTVEGTGRLVNAEGRVVLRENANLGPADAAPFEIQTATSFLFFNNPWSVLRPLRVTAALNVIYGTNSTYPNAWPLLTTNVCNWAGPVVLDGADASLKIRLTRESDSYTKDRAHDRQLSFMGALTGEGSLVVGSADRTGCGRVMLGGRNTYTGTTTVYGGDSSRLLACWHDSIPDYAKTTVDRGYVAARLGVGPDGTTERWPKDKLFAFRNTATFRDGGAFAIDATECPDGLFELTAKELLAHDERPDIGWGAAGGTVRITSEADDVLPICPNASRGTLELTGTGTFEMVGTNEIASVAGEATNAEARVFVTGGATVRQGKQPVFLGRANDYTESPFYPKAAGRLVVANAAWLSTVTDCPTDGSQAALREGALYVGSYGAGILDVRDGGLVSNKVVVGGGAYQQGGARGNGAVYVGAGGRLHVMAGGSAYQFASMLGMGGFGYLQVEAGAQVETESWFAVGGYGTGVLHQYGGTFTHTDSLRVQGLNNGNGVLYVAGGTCAIKKALFVASGNSANTTESRGAVTVDGPDAQLEAEDAYLGASKHGANRAWLNLNNGGRAHVNRLVPYEAAAEGSVYVGFDGGTVRRTSWSNFVHVYPSRVRLSVYEKGAAFDCACDTVISSEAPLAGRVAGGIQSIDASAVTNGFWIGAPYVSITGDGEGASAVADWDPVARRLKGVKLTSHGWGYTADKVKITLFTSHRSETLTNRTDAVCVSVGDNAIGGLTKLGPKALTLTATNSWQKWTQVDAGTLVAGSNGAIPSGTELRLNGGTLDLGGFDADPERPLTFAGLAGTGGTAVNGAVRLTGVWEISAKRFLARETTKLDGTLDLSGVTEIRLVDVDALDGVDADASRTLSLVMATTVIWPEKLTFTGTPKDWRFIRSGDRAIRLGFARGAMVIVR